MRAYLRPRTLAEALTARAAGGQLLSGGTDVWPVQTALVPPALAVEPLIDLSAVTCLHTLAVGSREVRIGALMTWTEIAEAALPPEFHALQAAAREVGGPQIQNRGTLAGNLCNASPAADGVPPLMCLDARVEIAGSRGERALPLSQFITGPRRTALLADEVLTAIVVPRWGTGSRSAFAKLGARRYQLISIVMGAVALRVEGGQIAQAAATIGACSPVAVRIPELEQALLGAPVKGCARLLETRHLSHLSPIEDVRADATYRREAALVTIRRLLTGLEATSSAT